MQSKQLGLDSCSWWPENQLCQKQYVTKLLKENERVNKKSASISWQAVIVRVGSSRLGVLSSLPSPLLSWYFKQLVEVLVFSGSLASLWLTSSGLFACPLFLFLSLAWVFSLYDVWQGFIRCFYWGHAQWSIKISNGPINIVLLKKEVMGMPVI